MKKLIKKMLFSFRSDSESYVEYLRKNGASVGNRVNIFDPRNTIIDVTRPWMISIGDDVQITSGVKILTHGYDWSVLKGFYGDVLGSCGEVAIGNNVFIGMNTIILKGVHIGDNCVIGANSLVNKDILSGWVAAGNPAKPIMKIEDYYKKRLEAQLSEAEELYRCYVQRIKAIPPKNVFSEFFWLFEKRDEKLEACEIAKMSCVGNFDYSMEIFKSKEPLFDGYDKFIESMNEKYPLI